MGINFTKIASIAKERTASRNTRPGSFLAKFEHRFCPRIIHSCRVYTNTMVKTLFELRHQSQAQSATASLSHADGKVSWVRYFKVEQETSSERDGVWLGDGMLKAIS